MHIKSWQLDGGEKTNLILSTLVNEGMNISLPHSFPNQAR